MNRLQEIRWEKNLSQEQLAIKSGVNRATISYIETSLTNNPRLKTARNLSQSLGVDIFDIFIF